MNILIACEFSGVVRKAFLARGHYAVSIDLLDTEYPGEHVRDNVLRWLGLGWDMMIAFPPCQYLAVSGARWWSHRVLEQYAALKFVADLVNAPIPRVAIENPVGLLSTVWRKPDQIVQPYMFGHGEVKRTCLWLRRLPVLKASNLVAGRLPRVHYEGPSAERWKNRSRTLPGLAAAMAEQWG